MKASANQSKYHTATVNHGFLSIYNGQNVREMATKEFGQATLPLIEVSTRIIPINQFSPSATLTFPALPNIKK